MKKRNTNNKLTPEFCPLPVLLFISAEFKVIFEFDCELNAYLIGKIGKRVS